MKVLVTGSEGRIGSALMPLLDDAVGYDLVNGDDILEQYSLERAMDGCDIVVHLAAIPGPIKDEDWERYFAINCRGMLDVAYTAVWAKAKRLIYASSTAYYGVEEGIDFDAPVVEGNAPFTAYINSVSCEKRHLAYATSKIIAEQILAYYGLSKQIEVVIFRFGPLKPGRGTSAETAAGYIAKAVEHPSPLQYEIYNVVDEEHGWANGWANSEKVRCTFG